MSADYFILLPDGTREGPYVEEELLELMDAGEVAPATRCLHAASGTVREAGTLFQVLAPLTESPPPPVPWKPAPFPQEQSPAKPAPPAVRIRLLYRGSPCVLTYWRSVLAAAALITGGVLLRGKLPSMLAVGLLSGTLVLLLAVLHRMRSQFMITSGRVEAHHGLISRNTRELRITDIRSINVVRRGITGLLGIGRVTFCAAAGSHEDIIFDRVWRATSLKNLVRRLQEPPA